MANIIVYVGRTLYNSCFNKYVFQKCEVIFTVLNKVTSNAMFNKIFVRITLTDSMINFQFLSIQNKTENYPFF